MSTNPKGKRLEQYTIQKPNEVLLVTIEILSVEDQILIFKGFSSSLMGSTSHNPDIPILPETAIIKSIDRLFSPYNPNQPEYIQQGLTWQEMESILSEMEI